MMLPCMPPLSFSMHNIISILLESVAVCCKVFTKSLALTRIDLSVLRNLVVSFKDINSFSHAKTKFFRLCSDVEITSIRLAKLTQVTGRLVSGLVSAAAFFPNNQEKKSIEALTMI